ncbi:MAG: DUF1631 family protein, partial [Gammaproteobacteria bacterium]
MSENNKNKISPHDKLVIDIRNNLTTRLTDLMSELLNTTQENLLEMYEEADNNEDQTRYFELRNQLRVLKPTIASTFDNKVKEFLIPADDYKARQAKLKAEAEDENEELSLVGQDEMEGIVLVKGIGERAGSQYREQLQHLEARLEHLALKTKTTFTKDALKPTNFCQAFNDALGDDFDNANKKLLFGLFETEITNKLNALYDSINNRLIDAGVLPQIKLHKQKQKPSRPRPKSPENANEAMDETQQSDFADGYAGDAGFTGAGGGYAASGGAGHAGSGAPGGMGPAGSSGGGSMAGGGDPAGSGYAGGPADPGGAGMAGGGIGGNNVGGFAMTAAPGGGYH